MSDEKPDTKVEEAENTTPPVAPKPSLFSNNNESTRGGEPLANANARVSMERAAGESKKEVLAGVRSAPMPVNDRIRANEQQGYHYHFFGDGEMRIQYAKALHYEFADDKGNAVDYDKAMKIGGLVRMRTRLEDYRNRKERINRVVNPEAQRRARSNFIQTGEALHEDTQPFDATRTRRGTFSQLGRRQADGTIREEG